MNNCLFDLYMPPLPTRSRGFSPISRESVRAIFRNQGGAVYPWCLSDFYFIVDRAWMFQALKSFHDFQHAVTGRPPQELYTSQVYNCVEFAEGFVAFLDLCHVLHWKAMIGQGKLGVGWACTGEMTTTLPDRHALTLFLTQEGGKVELWALEPQLEGIPAQYGKAACAQFFFALFS